ncbi:MAG: hypothetical protein ACHQCG_08215 [Solirubrobacterales bacterium]
MASRYRLRAAFLGFPALAASLVLAAHVGAATRPPRMPCPPKGQAVIAEDATMRVYRPKVTARNESELPVVACVIASRTRMTLIPASVPRASDRISDPGSLRRLVLAGDVAGLVIGHLSGVDTGYSEIVVADVARRAILRETSAGHSVDAGYVFWAGPTALDVAPDGGVAWIVETAARGPRPRDSAVFAAPRTGPIVTLDEGPRIEPESLFLSGDTVNWVDGGTTRSAPLPSAPTP